MNDTCKKCNGKGYLVNRKKVLRRCPKCLGCGELDWVENVVGPNKERGFPIDEQLIDRYYETNKKMLYSWRKTKWK
jgi:RecJ-like exonuclease